MKGEVRDSRDSHDAPEGVFDIADELSGSFRRRENPTHRELLRIMRRKQGA